jgi:hypothetical protein
MKAFRHIPLLVVFAMIMAACAGSSDSAAETSTTARSSDNTTTTQQPTPDTTPGTSAPTPATGGADGSSSATVTLAGDTYEFGDYGPPATCDADFFGGFFAVLYSADLSQTFQVELWNDGSGEGRSNTSSTNITAADGTEYDLDAIPDKSWPTVEAGTSRVESFTYEGNRATGIAYYINNEVAYGNDGPYEPIVGEFEVVCGEG